MTSLYARVEAAANQKMLINQGHLVEIPSAQQEAIDEVQLALKEHRVQDTAVACCRQVDAWLGRGIWCRLDRANRIAFAGNPDGCELQCVNCSGKSSCQGRAVRL